MHCLVNLIECLAGHPLQRLFSIIVNGWTPLPLWSALPCDTGNNIVSTVLFAENIKRNWMSACDDWMSAHADAEHGLIWKLENERKRLSVIMQIFTAQRNSTSLETTVQAWAEPETLLQPEAARLRFVTSLTFSVYKYVNCVWIYCTVMSFLGKEYWKSCLHKAVYNMPAPPPAGK